MVETSRPPADESFTADLNELRRRAGNPSLEELERRSGRKLSKSTLNGHLLGQRALLPPWRLVSAYVSACHAAAQSTGIDRKTLGTLKQWSARWNAASNGLPNPPTPFAESPTEPIDDEDNDPSRDPLSKIGRSQPVDPLLRRLLADIQQTQRVLSADSALLAVISGPNFAHRYELTHNITTIGRHAECDIWLNEPRVSRRHAQIRRYGEDFTIRDLGSKNGTFCENRRISREEKLMSYDQLAIVSFGLLFVQGGDDTTGLQALRYRSLQARLIRDSDADTSEFDVIR